MFGCLTHTMAKSSNRDVNYEKSDHFTETQTFDLINIHAVLCLPMIYKMPLLISIEFYKITEKLNIGE